MKKQKLILVIENKFLKYGIYFILLISVILLFHKIDKLFIGHHDWNGAFWGVITRNYLGHIQKFLGNPNWQTTDNISANQFVFYQSYTFFMPLLFTISALFFGVNEMSMRLVTVIFSVVMLFFIYKIGEYVYNRKIGLIASVLALATPMFQYYGKLPDHEPILTSLCTISFYFYITLKKNCRKKYFWFYFFLLCTLLESWGGFFFLFFLIMYSLIFRREEKKLAIFMILLGLIVMSSHLFAIYLANGKSALESFFLHGLGRMNLNKNSFEQKVISFDLKLFSITIGRFAVIYFTRFLLLLSSIWILIKSRYLLLKRKTSKDNVLFVLFLYGITFVLVFSNLSFIHDYKIYLLLPFISLSSAYVFDFGLTKLLNLVSNKFKFFNKPILYFVFLSIFIYFVSTERLDFLKTQLNSSYSKPGYELGEMIKNKTQSSDTVLVNSGEFDSFYGVFVRFYANRKIEARDLKMSDYDKKLPDFSKYKFIVMIEGRATDEEIKKYLLENYVSGKNGDFIFVATSNKKI